MFVFWGVRVEHWHGRRGMLSGQSGFGPCAKAAIELRQNARLDGTGREPLKSPQIRPSAGGGGEGTIMREHSASTALQG